jgi:pimeloyl-ACP methyl ester carboxylesterase
MDVHLCEPSAAPVGRCLLFLGGHATTGWNVFYCNPDGSSVILRMLAAGWHVAVADMPNYGLQPTQAVVINGQLETIAAKNTFHMPSGETPPFDAPPMIRLFLDHLILACNWIQANVTTHMHLAGVSGGGATATQLAAIDDRFETVNLMQFGDPGLTAGSLADTESWTQNDLYVAATNQTISDMAVIASAVTGRDTVFHSADADEYLADIHVEWESVVSNWAPVILRDFGGTLEFYRKTTGTHSIDAAQAAWLESYLVAHA